MKYPGGGIVEIDDPYRYGRVISDYDLYLFGEGKHTRIYDKLGAHPMRIGDGGRRALRACGRPTPQRVSVVGDFNGVGRPRASDAVARRERRVGDLHPRGAARAAVQVRDPRARTATSCSRPIRSASPSRCRRCRRRSSAIPSHEWHDAAWMAVARGDGLVVRAADGGLRSAPRIVGAHPGRRRSLSLLRRSWRRASFPT